MSALSSPTVNGRQPIGNRFLVTGRVAVTTTAGHVAQASLNLARIDSVLGVCGGTTTPSSHQAMPNTQTQATANLNYGDLSLDSSASVTASFAVLGR